MSSINEALKKAQKEKEIHQIRYRGVLWTKNDESGLLKKGPIRVTLALLLILISILLIAFWFDFMGTSPRVTKQIDKPPAPVSADAKADPMDLYGNARSLHRQGRFQEAKRLYQEILRVDPGFIDVLNNLGVLYIHDRDYSAAQRTLEKAARLEPESAVPYYNLACLYTIKGDLEQGLDYLEKAVSLDPSVRGWAQKDTDLKNLRTLSGFIKMIESDDQRWKDIKRTDEIGKN